MTKLNSKGMNAKRKNHTVPRSLLVQWVQQDASEKQGIHYIDCIDGCQQFEEGQQANFAISEYRYVPIGSDGYRDELMENWFGPDENALATLAKETTAKSFGKSMSPEAKEKAIRACIILGYRSNYEFEKLGIARKLSSPSSSDKEIQRELVSHFWKIYQLKLEQFKHWEFTIFHNLPEKLLICDRPLFDGTVHVEPTPMIVLPIAPNAFLLGCPAVNSDEIRPLSWVDGSKSNLGRFMNHQAVMRAREFLVGDAAQLTSLANQMKLSEIESRKNIDRFVFQTFK